MQISLSRFSRWNPIVVIAAVVLAARYKTRRCHLPTCFNLYEGAGGILAGRGITERPDLFGAGVMSYSLLNRCAKT